MSRTCLLTFVLAIGSSSLGDSLIPQVLSKSKATPRCGKWCTVHGSKGQCDKDLGHQDNSHWCPPYRHSF